MARRAGFTSNYNFDDVRKVLEVLVMAFAAEPAQSLKAVNE
jgi:hypothetical protein